MNKDPDEIANKIGIFASNSHIDIQNLNIGKINRKDILKRTNFLIKIKSEVESRLEQSLHRAVLINIDKEKQFDQVKRSWDIEVKVGSQPSKLVSKDLKAIDIFDLSSVAGRLLILGDLGSGKTTTLLEIAKELIERAYTNYEYPLPVLVNLSSWRNDKQTISQWLLSQINQRYGVSKNLVKKWLKENQILPLLDGLDELEAERQQSCILELNKFLNSEEQPLYMVICCRKENYEYQNLKLKLNGAIYLQPLSRRQISEYLSSIKLSELWDSIQNSSIVLELINAPLFLSMLALAYKQISIDEWNNCNTPERCREYLLGVYVNQMFNREIESHHYKKGGEPKPEQIYEWLIWISKNLRRESRDYFSIELLQPDWLNNSRQKFLYHTINVIIGGLFIGLIITPITGLTSGLIIGLLSWLIQLPYSIKPIISLKFSWQEVLSTTKTSISKYCKLGWMFSILLTILFYLSNLASLNIISLIVIFVAFSIIGTLSALILGLIPSLISGLLTSIEFSDIDPKISLAKRVWKSICSGGIIGFTLGLTFGLISGLVLSPSFGLIFGSLIGFLVALAISSSLIQSVSLSLIIWLTGNAPLYYSRFLDYAVEKLILQKIGSQYRFIHTSLLSYLSQRDLLSLNTHRETITTKSNPKENRFAQGLKAFLLLIMSFFFIRIYAAEPRVMVSATVMNPEMSVGDRLIVDKLTYHFFMPKRGEMILFKHPFKETSSIINRRVIGLPNERIVVRNGQLFVNGVIYQGNYITLLPPTNEGNEIDVPNDMYLVLGNIDIEKDRKSKYLHLVHRQDIIGRTVFRYWPPERISKLW